MVKSDKITWGLNSSSCRRYSEAVSTRRKSQAMAERLNSLTSSSASVATSSTISILRRALTGQFHVTSNPATPESLFLNLLVTGAIFVGLNRRTMDTGRSHMRWRSRRCAPLRDGSRSFVHTAPVLLLYGPGSNVRGTIPELYAHGLTSAKELHNFAIDK